MLLFLLCHPFPLLDNYGPALYNDIIGIYILAQVGYPIVGKDSRRRRYNQQTGGEVVQKEKKGGLLGTAAVMAVIILAAKALGLLRDILVGTAYGTTAPAVAYETASRLPVLIFDFVIGGVVSAAFIPVFSDLLVREGKKSAMRFAASYVNLIFLLTSILTVAGVAFASPLVDLLAPELAPEVKALAVELTRILFPMVICTGLAFSFVGILQSMGEFRIPALISLVSNLIMVGYLLFFLDDFGVHGLAVAMLCGWGAQALIQAPKLRQFGFRLVPSAGILSPHIVRSLKLALPILVGTWTQPLCTVINTNFASAMDGGRAITALGYANRLYTILVGVFAFVATNLLFPHFSRAAAAGDTDTSRRLMFTSVKTLSFIIAPIAAGLAVLAEPITAILFERRAFTPADTALTATALRCFAVGMLFMAANEVLSKSFFAENRPKIPMITSLIAMVVNVGLVVVLSRFGIGGIALSSGIAVAVQCLGNAIAYCRVFRTRFARADLLDLGKSVLAALIMGGAVYVCLPHLPGGYFVQTVLSVLIGAIVYAAGVLLLRSEEASFVIARVKRTGK